MDTKSIVQEWVPLDPMPEARWGANAANWGGKIWVFGGCSGGPILDTATTYDPKTGEWMPIPHMSNRRTNACVTAVGKRIYVCGGFGGSLAADAPLDSAERFDPQLNQWEAIPNMTAKRFSAASACMGPLLFMFGGSTDKPDPLKSVERFDAREGKCTWEPMPSMNDKRQGSAAAILNGIPFLCGGHNGVCCLDTAEYLSPTGRPWMDGGTAGTWKAAPTMLSPRYCAIGCVAVLNPSKAKVMVFGGHDGLERVATAECVDMDGDWEFLPKNPPLGGGVKMTARSGAAIAAMMPADSGRADSGAIGLLPVI